MRQNNTVLEWNLKLSGKKIYLKKEKKNVTLCQGIFLAGWRKSETAYSLFLSSHVTHLSQESVTCLIEQMDCQEVQPLGKALMECLLLLSTFIQLSYYIEEKKTNARSRVLFIR